MNKYKIIFIFFTACFYWSNLTYSQLLYNGNFSLPNNGNDLSPTVNCPTFSDNSIPNWKRSHGSPELITTSSNNEIHMKTNFSLLGEGIVGNFDFKANQTYVIELWFSHMTFADGVHAQSDVMIFACNGLTQNLSGSGVATEGQCYHDNDLVTTASSLLLKDITSPTYYVKIVMPAQSSAFSQIWIFPKIKDLIENIGNEGATEIKLSRVNISAPCESDKYFTSGTIPAENHYGFNNIFVGTSFHSNPGTVTNSNGFTSLLAGQSVLFQDNTLITVNENSFLYAAIIPCGNTSTGPASKIGQNTFDYIGLGDNNDALSSQFNYSNEKKFTDNKEDNNMLSIYPNPTTDLVIVETPEKSNYTIRVMNIVGSMVYEGKMEGEQRKQIQLDQNLPPGNYTIHINGDGIRHVEKLVITK